MDKPAGDRATDGEPLGGAEIRERAATGVALDGLRGVANLVFSLGGMVALARMLGPRDFGLVAFGLAILAFGAYFAHGGFAAAFIRRAAQPSRRELEAIQGFQLAITLAAVVVTAAATWPLGTAGHVTAIMVASLPLLVLRTPAVVALERELRYRLITIAEVTEIAAYYVFAVAAVAAGGGVWAFAAASVVRAAVGSLVMASLAPGWSVRPRFDWQSIRGIVAFGAMYQAVGLAQTVRLQAVNLTVAAVAGIDTLGLWTIAERVLQLPHVFFASLWRVSFPAASRLVAAGEDMLPLIRRAVAVAAVGTGVMLVPLVAGAPALVPSVLGERWHDSAYVLPAAGLGLMFAGPISVAVVGYLWALGDGRTPLVGMIISIVAWELVMAPSLPLVGVAAVGIGWLAACIAETAVLARGVSARLGGEVFSPVIRPTLIGAFAAGAGWIFARAVEPTLVYGLLAAILATLLYVAGAALVCRSQLAELTRMSAWMVRLTLHQRGESGSSSAPP